MHARMQEAHDDITSRAALAEIQHFHEGGADDAVKIAHACTAEGARAKVAEMSEDAHALSEYVTGTGANAIQGLLLLTLMLLPSIWCLTRRR